MGHQTLPAAIFARRSAPLAAMAVLLLSCRPEPSTVSPGGWIADDRQDSSSTESRTQGSGGAPSSRAQSSNPSPSTSTRSPNSAPGGPSAQAAKGNAEKPSASAASAIFEPRDATVGDKYVSTIGFEATFNTAGSGTAISALSFTCSRDERVSNVDEGSATRLDVSFGACGYDLSTAEGKHSEQLAISKKRYVIQPRGPAVDIRTDAGQKVSPTEQQFLEGSYTRLDGLPPHFLANGPLDPGQSLRLSSEQLATLFGDSATIKRAELVFADITKCDDIPCARFEADFEASVSVDLGEAVITGTGNVYFLLSGRRLARLEATGTIEVCPAGDDRWISGTVQMHLNETATLAAPTRAR